LVIGIGYFVEFAYWAVQCVAWCSLEKGTNKLRAEREGLRRLYIGWCFDIFKRKWNMTCLEGMVYA